MQLDVSQNIEELQKVIVGLLLKIRTMRNQETGPGEIIIEHVTKIDLDFNLSAINQEDRNYYLLEIKKI
jgi:hypothetical protein